MEYTNEFLARVYGAYIGCPVMLGDNDKHVLESVNRFENTVGCSLFGEVIAYFKFDECNLLLTPLSEISDEDAMKVFSMVVHPNIDYPRNDYHFSKTDSGSTKVIINNDWYNSTLIIGSKNGIVWMPHKDNARVGACVYDYLRSNKRPDGTEKPVYDCGYAEIPSLIEAGIAIKTQQP